GVGVVVTGVGTLTFPDTEVFPDGAVTLVEGAVTFVEGAVTLVEGAVVFCGWRNDCARTIDGIKTDTEITAVTNLFINKSK
ncbi:hypothetical protein KW783_02695, partial [Candidatus Parcubacteria bacterium]|nr:hypothetical protein [Candidatus Parcubacteria bacterium]